MEIIQVLESKIIQLGQQKSDLKSEVLALKAEIESLKSVVAQKHEEIDELSQKYQVLKTAKSLEGASVESKTDVKLKINEMVREIDNCIALLKK